MATGNSINANQTGIQSYDGAGTWSGCTLQSTSPNLVITNPNGVGGNPSFAVTGFTTWTDVTGTTQAMSTFNGYIADNASLVTFSLPATANIGDTIRIIGKGAGGWKVTQAVGQQINVGIVASTAGTGGSIASSKQFDTVDLTCITAGSSTIWTARVTGNITVV